MHPLTRGYPKACQHEWPQPLGPCAHAWGYCAHELLEHELSPAFEVRDEVSVGTLPLRADIVLVRRGEAEIPESARRSFRALTERLNRWTLIEFKSPVDSLERGDLGRLFGVGHLFVAQQADAIVASDVSFVILAPSLIEAARSGRAASRSASG